MLNEVHEGLVVEKIYFIIQRSTLAASLWILNNVLIEHTINSVNCNVLRCQHSHIYKLCQSLRHSNSVLKLQCLKMWETLLPCLTTG